MSSGLQPPGAEKLQAASLTIANSNRIVGWLRAMDSLRVAIGAAA